VNRSIRKQRHEVARKRHRQQLQELERALERRKPSQTAAWILGITLTLFLGFVILVLVW
jgi:DNA-binding transcriptional regulator YbjK